MAEKATDPQLSAAFTGHLRETEHQVIRLERIAQILGVDPDEVTCKAMKGLVKEAEEVMGEAGSPETLDAGMIGAAQKVEHYEIAAYGTAGAYARRLGLIAVARILQETLNEESAANEKLTRLAESGIKRRSRHRRRRLIEQVSELPHNSEGRLRLLADAIPQLIWTYGDGTAERIFEPFVQAAPSLTLDAGLELGLAVVRRLVRLHDGRDRGLQRRDGEGQRIRDPPPALFLAGIHGCFPPCPGGYFFRWINFRPFDSILSLSRRRRPPAEHQKEPPRPARTSVKDKTWATMKILLVEDHPGVAEMSSRVLRELYGHEVHWAETGAQALKAASLEKPELVLIDLNLPDMSGFEVARTLRSNPVFDHTLLVAVTGFGTFVNDEMAKEAGLDAFFRKPLDFDMLEHLKRP